jgi:CRP-like cAMP-binding protein
MNTFELLETVLFFKKTMLFRNVSAEKLMGLAEISTLVSYTRGDTISREGDISEHLYIVRNGSLKIVKEKNGVKTILSIVRRGEAYGEIGLFNNAPRSASAVANENCEVFVIQRSSLKRLLMEMPEIAYNFLEIFSEKLRRSGEEVALLHTTLSGRIRESV